MTDEDFGFALPPGTLDSDIEGELEDDQREHDEWHPEDEWEDDDE